MPIIWIRFNPASVPGATRLRRKPKELKRVLAGVVKHAQREAELLDLYFKLGNIEGQACALVKDLDNYGALQDVLAFLGTDDYTKFLTAEQAESAIKRQARLVPKPRPRPKR